jgi:hypothetical protein
MTRPGHGEYKKYRRCGALIASSATGRRCKRESITGPDEEPRCERHYAPIVNKSMSKYYREALRPALAARVERIMEETPGVALTAVHEELAVARMAAEEIVALYGMAKQHDIDQNDGKQGQATAGAAIATVDMMTQITKIAQAAASIDKQRAEVAGSMVQAIELIISRVTKAAFDAFGDDHRVVEFVESLHTEVLEPLGQGQAGLRALRDEYGTPLLPSGESINEQVRAMDDMVPAGPDDEN